MRRRHVNYFAIISILVVVLAVSVVGLWWVMNSKNEKITEIKVEDKVIGKYTITKQNGDFFDKYEFIDENYSKLFHEKRTQLKEAGATNNCGFNLFYKDLLQYKCENSDFAFIYSLSQKKEIVYNDIFRKNINLLKAVLPNVEVEKLDKTKLSFKNNTIFLDGNQIEIESNPRLFKHGLGIKSLYTGERITPKHYKYDMSKKIIAFTYDDGPLNENHDRIRDLFNQHNIPATFYVIGSLVEKYPEKVLKTYQDGHTIANHTYTHPGLPNANLTNIPQKKAIEEVEKTDDIIYKTIGVDPTTMRPPGGFINDKVKALIPHRSVLWTVDSQDWRNKKDGEAVYQNVKRNIKDKSIVLFHDLYDSSYEATKRLIPELISEGYQFVDIDTLLDEIDKG